MFYGPENRFVNSCVQHWTCFIADMKAVNLVCLAGIADSGRFSDLCEGADVDQGSPLGCVAYCTVYGAGDETQACSQFVSNCHIIIHLSAVCEN